MLRPTNAPERDVYANLLRDTRMLQRDQASAREVWFGALPWERKEETLFELEMLLKGLVCFGNPRNHPGPAKRPLAVAHDFQAALRIMRDALDRCGVLFRQLLGQKDRAYTFSRYLESVLPEDAARSELVKEQLSQDTPEEALFLLRNAFTSYVDLADGLLRVGRIPHRMFHALHSTVTREVGRNTYFNPLVALEFRPEFDRLRSPEVLDALHVVKSEAAHRVTALTFLALFRALRYVALIDEYAADRDAVRRAYIVLAVLRSDLRALTRFLSRRAADVMADGLEQELLAVRAVDVAAHGDALAAQARALIGLRDVLDSVGGALRVEVRKAFERDLPAPDAEISDADLAPKLVIVAAQLRAALHHSVHLLCAELRPGAPLPELATDAPGRRAAGERLRREVWMFGQILRAFNAKAGAVTGTTDQWAGAGSFQFVREFLGHFRAIGYQLVRLSDYERLAPFLASLQVLRDVDLLAPERMREATRESLGLHAHLEQLFAELSRRAELAATPFDKKAAAETLRIYLGAV